VWEKLLALSAMAVDSRAEWSEGPSAAAGNLVVLCHGRFAHMYKKTSTDTECVKRRMCTGDSSFSCMSVTFAYTRCVFFTH